MDNPKINECVQLIEEMESEVDSISDNIIWVDDSIWCILVEEENPNEISLSFHIDTNPARAATIAMKLSESSSKIGMQVVVYESYAFILDEEDRIEAVVFGQEAFDVIGRVPL